MPKEPTIDLAFIDADKSGYLGYYEELIARAASERRRSSSTTSCGPAGSSMPNATDDDTVAIRAFNDHVVADERVDVVMLPIGDGLTLARKR